MEIKHVTLSDGTLVSAYLTKGGGNIVVNFDNYKQDKTICFPVHDYELDHYTTDSDVDMIMEELDDKVKYPTIEDVVGVKKVLLPLVDMISAKVY